MSEHTSQPGLVVRRAAGPTLAVTEHDDGAIGITYRDSWMPTIWEASCGICEWSRQFEDTEHAAFAAGEAHLAGVHDLVAGRPLRVPRRRLRDRLWPFVTVPLPAPPE